MNNDEEVMKKKKKNNDRTKGRKNEGDHTHLNKNGYCQ